MTNLTNKLFLPVFMLLLSISPAAAHNDTFFNSPHRLELKPASFAEGGYRLAKSYWLGGADLDLNFKDEDDKTRCNSMGYFQEACQGNKSPLLKCPYNSAYVKCTCDTSVYRYSALNCPSGSYPDEDVCDDYSKGCVCENNRIWSAEDNSCVGCLSDSDCADGKECNNRECVNIDLCAGVNCTGGQSCNSETGACECPPGEVFYNNRCEAPSCTNKEIQCSGSTPVCAANGQCVECISASDCGANEICSGNTCQTVDRCKDVSCSGGKSCNPNNGQCECPSDKPYESGGICEAPNCANGGVTCPSGQTCNKTSKLCETTKTPAELCVEKLNLNSTYKIVTNFEELQNALQNSKYVVMANDIEGDSISSGDVIIDSIAYLARVNGSSFAECKDIPPVTLKLNYLKVNAGQQIHITGGTSIDIQQVDCFGNLYLESPEAHIGQIVLVATSGMNTQLNAIIDSLGIMPSTAVYTIDKFIVEGTGGAGIVSAYGDLSVPGGFNVRENVALIIALTGSNLIIDSSPYFDIGIPSTGIVGHTEITGQGCLYSADYKYCNGGMLNISYYTGNNQCRSDMGDFIIKDKYNQCVDGITYIDITKR